MAGTNSIAQTMAARMRELRASRGLTLQQVADRANAGKSHIWELENGRSKNPSIEMAVSLARAFGVSLDYLTGLSAATPSLHPEALRIATEIDALLAPKCSPRPGPTREEIEAGFLSGDEPCECGETTVEECDDCCEPKPLVCPHNCYFPGDCDGSCTHPAPEGSSHE